MKTKARMKIVVVGSGLAGVTVAEGLAKSGLHEVSLVTTETLGYYSRPRLSHGVALAEDAAAKILMKRFDALASVTVRAGTEAWLIDRQQQRLVLPARRRAFRRRCCPRGRSS
jgi:NAD(P)H-nitrite reductase large subunit